MTRSMGGDDHVVENLQQNKPKVSDVKCPTWHDMARHTTVTVKYQVPCSCS